MISRTFFSSRVLLLGTACVLTSSFAAPALAGFEFTPPPAAVVAAEDTDGVMPPVTALPVGEVEIIDVTMTDGTSTEQIEVVAETVLDDLPPPPRPMPVMDDVPPTAQPEPMMRLSPAAQAPAPHVHASNVQAPRAPQDAAPVAPVQKSVQQPVRRQPALVVTKSAQSPAPTHPVSAPVSHHANAEGFGRDLPLVLAMRQIVPVGYGYTFDPSVDQGQRVDWDGGAPWPTVLENAVAAYGLSVRVMDDASRVWVGPANVAAPVSAPTDTMVVEDVAAPVVADTATTTHEPVREVYIRRGEKEAEVMTRDAAPQAAVVEAPAAVEAPMPLMAVEEVSFVDPVATPRAPDDMTMSDATLTAPAPLAADDMVQASFDPYAIQSWTAAKGASLRDVLAQWSDEAGVQLVWPSDRDYKLPQAINMNSNYADAVLRALSMFDHADARPLGKLHPNLPQGPSVLLVETKAS
ncbi:TcpQ domain-containing protein [Micavibrio aeruginosavorus]|uniref:TcpQ domain-containing protein n=1 Tax=Micavibrio aeruginosavorus TaxID=349221 RepID=UPI003F4A9C5B